MINEVIASAPGKIIWIGNYAVLERGTHGFITSIDKRVYAKATEIATTLAPKVHILSPQLGLNEKGTCTNGKIDIETPLAKFVKTAIEITLRYLEFKKIKLKGIALETYSDPAFSITGGKSGLGSSAAVTVATVAAVLSLHGVDIEKEKNTLHKLAQYAHCTSQGKVGSGFDVATSTFGAIEYSRFSPELITQSLETVIDREWDYTAKPLTLPSVFTAVIANIPNTSTSTTQMVASVKKYKDKNPVEYSALIEKLDKSNRSALKALKSLKSEGTETVNEFRTAFEYSRSLVRELGEKSGTEIEPENLGEMIEKSKLHGAFIALLPGAGGGDSIVALCLSQRDASRLREFWTSQGFQVLNATTSNTGVKIEKELPLN